MTVTELWFARSTQGYGGKGATKPSGYEHHQVRAAGGALKVDSDGRFKNFGIHDFTLTSDQKRLSSRFGYGNGEVVVTVGRTDAGWAGKAKFAGSTAAFAIDAPGDLGLPSVVGRFLPMILPRELGDLTTYAPVPEDGFPWWWPGDGRSWFGLVGGWTRDTLRKPSSAVRTIVGRGEESTKVGRSTVTAFRYDHTIHDGALVAATTWIGEGGEVLRYEQQGTVLVAVPQEAALALDPLAATTASG